MLSISTELPKTNDKQESPNVEPTTIAEERRHIKKRKQLRETKIKKRGTITNMIYYDHHGRKKGNSKYKKQGIITLLFRHAKQLLSINNYLFEHKYGGDSDEEAEKTALNELTE